MPPLVLSFIIAGITTGTVITMSSHHWLMAWLGLELNTLAILPIISKPKHPRSIEAATKYFLIQSIASSILLFSSITNAWLTGHWNITLMQNEYACLLMTISLAMKMGAAPLHFWLPEVIQGSTLSSALLITTWQKIAPIVLMYMTSNHLPPNTLMTIGALSILVGGAGGMNQTQLRKMMAYSSIAHIGWTMLAMATAPNISMLNIIIYMIMTAPTFLLLMQTTTKTLQDITTTWTTTPAATMTLTMLLLSLGGLPPLTGFIPKLLILNELIMQKLTPLATLMALTSLLSLLFYLRTTYLIAMTTAPTTTTSQMKWRAPNHSYLLTPVTTPTALASAPTTPSLIT
uniref:NADH-ubiquinone oxidoreductase chain 2 n=1 Tax=Hydrosaurus sp. 1 CDS-2013 TaxID=1433298 RepID=V5TEE8_9SAUR|nr:NADH dehydrogenase subunit 2 [Hydrosaurus sp. 1 CDS-2013]